MPQDFMVLKCFQCEMFQVHQVRKAKKWICKICNETQSQIKIFGQGDAKFCRTVVQGLNLKKISGDQLKSEIETSEQEVKNIEDNEVCMPKWKQFKPESQDSTSSENEGNFTTEMDEWVGNKNKGKRKRKQLIVNKQSKKLSLHSSQTVEPSPTYSEKICTKTNTDDKELSSSFCVTQSNKEETRHFGKWSNYAVEYISSSSLED